MRGYHTAKAGLLFKKAGAISRHTKAPFIARTGDRCLRIICMISAVGFCQRWQYLGLVGALALALCMLPSKTNATAPTSDLGGALTFLADRAEEGTFSGVVLVARNGEAPVVRSYGKADFELGTPVQSNSIFAIASLTKLVTAATVLRLVDDKKMNLETTVCAFLANCPVAWRTVTIENLLDHSSGIPDLFDGPGCPTRRNSAGNR